MKLTQGGAKPWDSDENVQAVLRVREKSRQALLARDFSARRETYSSTYVAHTPDYTIVDEEALIAALTSGRVSYDSSEYSLEYAKVHAPEMVVLMGVETVMPSAGRPNAGLKVPRRFTDIYRKERGEWRHDIRHAHIAVADLARGVVPPSSPARRISSDPHVRQVLDYRKRTLDGLGAGTSRDPTGRYASTFIANTPHGAIVSGAEMRALFSGSIGYSRVEQSIEYAARHAPDLIVVMGCEVVVPREGTPNAGKNIHRRFSDVFRLEDGEWRHDVRHANIWKIE
ncbi:MAG: nuclear transport factor 2 family protein [Alphaproteobacteria bacterium]